MEKTKILTSNIPVLDDIIYYTKVLVLRSVLKDQDKADNNESVESRKNGDKYLLCMDGYASFHMFEYDEPMLRSVLVPQSILMECVEDNSKIPDQYRPLLLKNAVESFIENYEEKNNYYRMLNGLPDLGDPGIILDPNIYDISDIVGIDFSKKLHEMTDDEVDILYALGVIDKVLENNPDKKYLEHLGPRKISIYQARKADRFELLYVPEGEVPTEILNRYKNKFLLNRSYTLKTIYSDAFKFGSDYYDNFIAILILIQTMVDMIIELPEYIIKREVFDYRMVQVLFESNGIEYFPEIPFRYQKALISNLNKLIKYKSTTVDIVNICNLFGFENIKVFKYYLLRDRKLDADGNYVFEYKEVTDENGNKKYVEDLSKEYDLKFMKVPIDGEVDKSLYDNTKMSDYDDVVLGDKYWNGTEEHEIIKQRIIETEFNYLQSKYFSIDTIYNLTSVAFDVCYFFNMVFDNDEFEKLILIRVPLINSTTSFKLVDLICYLFALAYEYQGIKDSIMDTQGKVLHIKGFNFKADLAELAKYVEEKGYTLADLGVDEFQIPVTSMTFNQLLNVFTKNKAIYDHITYEIVHANNKRIYDIYKKLYDSLMITDLNMKVFTDKNRKIYSTYTDFLKDRDSILYYSLLKIREITNVMNKKQQISDYIDAIVYSLEDFIKDKTLFNNILSYIPTVSAESVKYYIYKVIDFFKSYKVQLMNINIVYIFGRIDTYIKMIDDISIQYNLTKADVYKYIDKTLNNVYLTKEERDLMHEKLYIDPIYWKELFLSNYAFKKEVVINTSKPTFLEKELYRDRLDIIPFNN